MTTLLYPVAFNALDGEQQSALARLDDDLAAIAQTAPDSRAIDVLDTLRRRVLTSYRDALAHAAGQPRDPRWTALIASIQTLLTHVPAVRYSYAADVAVGRLRALVEESAELG